MPILTKRWNDPVDAADGHRLLICRFRPRGLKKQDETWGAWDTDFAPSKRLLDAFHGKGGYAISWPQYRRRYIAEQHANAAKVAELARRSQAGETITLLCSSSCVDPDRCHRTVLKELIDDAAGALPAGTV